MEKKYKSVLDNYEINKNNQNKLSQKPSLYQQE